MSEIKPVASVKTADQEMSEWMKSKQTTSMTYGELYTFFERKEVKKLRAACEALQKENAELRELLGKSLEALKNDCKAFADCRQRPYSMSQAEQEAWFSCWNSIYDDIDNLDLSKYEETKKVSL